MPSLPDLRHFLVSLRIDAIAFAIAVAVGLWACRREVRRRGLRLRSERRVLATTAGVTVLAILAAECMGRSDWLTLPTASEAANVALRRVAAFAAASGVLAWLVLSTVVMAHLRERLRSHLRIERRLRAARAAAEDANRAKSDFLVTMSHEIRTPLNALLTSADFLVQSSLEPNLRAHATTIVNEGMRLGAALNEILDLRRIEERRLVLDRVPFSPIEAAQEAVRLFSARAQEKRLELSVEAHVPRGLLIAGDPRRFRQVIVNLLDNAIKFTRRGGVTVSLDFNAAPEATRPSVMGVRIRDTGIGIPPEQRAALFTSPNGSPAGRLAKANGLGLLIAQQLVQLMGGEIFVHSTPGMGSEFAFTLPVSVLPGSDEPTLEPTVPVLQDARNAVLIVDDVAANRVLLQMFLEKEGFRVAHASGGDEAVQLARRNRYDAILMDIQMPTTDGYAATRRIRAEEAPGQRTLILAVTASGDKVSRERCLASGMDEHFAKPLELTSFCRALHELIALRARQSGTDAREPVAG